MVVFDGVPDTEITENHPDKDHQLSRTTLVLRLVALHAEEHTHPHVAVQLLCHVCGHCRHSPAIVLALSWMSPMALIQDSIKSLIVTYTVLAIQ